MTPRLDCFGVGEQHCEAVPSVVFNLDGELFIGGVLTAMAAAVREKRES